MPKLPQVSGNTVVRVLKSLGYEVLRQRGSHVRLYKNSPLGEHNLTVPLHNPVAKGTLNDILNKVSLWNGIPRDELIERMK